jgi:hypothetical protein
VSLALLHEPLRQLFPTKLSQTRAQNSFGAEAAAIRALWSEKGRTKRQNRRLARSCPYLRLAFPSFALGEGPTGAVGCAEKADGGGEVRVGRRGYLEASGCGARGRTTAARRKPAGTTRLRGCSRWAWSSQTDYDGVARPAGAELDLEFGGGAGGRRWRWRARTRWLAATGVLV